MGETAIEALQADLAEQTSRLVRVQAAVDPLLKIKERSEEEEKALVAAEGTLSALTDNITALQQQIASLRKAAHNCGQ